MNKKNEYRVWWVPQVGKSNAFYIPVETPEQGKQIINILSAYDCFQYNQRVKAITAIQVGWKFGMKNMVGLIGIMKTMMVYLI